nr:hypothetical protein [Staphylococcus agnetis]
MPVWSKVTIAGMSLEEFEKLSDKPRINKEAISQQIDKVSFAVLKNKGWTNVAISKTTVNLVKSLVLNEKSVMPITSLQEQDQVAISLPTLTHQNGINQVFDITLDEAEQQHFEAAKNYIKATINIKNQR